MLARHVGRPKPAPLDDVCFGGYPIDHRRMRVFNFIGFLVTIAATLLGYWQARQFTQSKLRYVDAVHRVSVAAVAGGVAALIAAPVVWLLPIVGVGTALLFGAGVAAGVAAGARDIRKRLGAG
jgi:fatty acid desaturase